MKAIRKHLVSLRNLRLRIVSTLLIIVTILILYWQDFSILANEAMQNEAMSHIVLVPLLVSFLIYQRRKLIGASLASERLRPQAKIISLSQIGGIAFCLSAFLLYWYGSYTFYPLEYHTFSLVAFLIGIILILFNAKILKVLIFPILFLIFLVPPPSTLIFSAGAVLGVFSSQASYMLLRTVGLPVALSSEHGPPTIMISNTTDGTNALEFAVDVSCSGIYSLVAFTMFAAFLAYAIRGSAIKRIALFPLGFIMLTVFNFLRISLILFIAYQLGEAIAMTIFHLFSGWFLVFFGMFLLLLITERFLHLHMFAGRNKIASGSKCDHTSAGTGDLCLYCGILLKRRQTRFPKRFWIRVIVLLLSTYLVTFVIQAPVFAFTERLIITDPNQEVSTEIFPRVADYRPHFLSRDRDFEKVSGQDASLLYLYTTNSSDPYIWVLVGVSSSRTDLHAWEVCWYAWQIALGYPPLIDVIDSKEIQLMQDPPIAAQFFVFQHPDNYTQVTLYWYLKALYRTGLTVESKYTRISLIIFTRNPNEYPELEQKLLSVGQAIASYWEPLKTQSLASLGIPTMQVLLGLCILAAIITQTTQYARKWIRKTTNLRIFERLASPKEKALYQTIKELAQKTKETTTQNIALAFGKAASEEVKANELINLLNNLEKAGIIMVDVADIKGDPRLVWKS